MFNKIIFQCLLTSQCLYIKKPNVILARNRFMADVLTQADTQQVGSVDWFHLKWETSCIYNISWRNKKWPFMNSSIDKHFKNKGKVILRSLKPEADGSLPATMVLLKGREWSLSFSVLSLSFLWPLLLARQLSPTFRDSSESTLVGYFHPPAHSYMRYPCLQCMLCAYNVLFFHWLNEIRFLSPTVKS